MTELIITWQGLLFEAVSFLIFTYLLNLFLFRPIRAILKKRETVIVSKEDKQKDLERLIDAFGEKAEQTRQNLKLELNELKEKFRMESQAEANKIMFDAKNRAVANFDKTLNEFKSEKIHLTDSLNETTGYLSVLISKKIIG